MNFVSMVNFEGRLLAMTDTGAVWRFQPGWDGLPNDAPKWTPLADGPDPPGAIQNERLFVSGVEPITPIAGL
jgi:hypothetical protein